jgi:hypothetical protein
MVDCVSAALRAGIAEVLDGAVKYAINPLRVYAGVCSVPPGVSSAMLDVVAAGAVAAVQAAPGGGPPELLAAAQSAAGRVMSSRPPLPLFWLELGLVPPEVHDQKYLWRLLLPEPLTIFAVSLPGVPYAARLGDRLVWQWTESDRHQNRGRAKAKWSSLKCHGWLDRSGAGIVPPPWNRQGFTLAEWEVVWRYLACFCMFDGGPLERTVAVVQNARLSPCEVWAELVRGAADPKWATLQEVGDWALAGPEGRALPATHWWVFIAAGYKIRVIDTATLVMQLLTTPGNRIVQANSRPWSPARGAWAACQ